jgi:hypothetical protein
VSGDDKQRVEIRCGHCGRLVEDTPRRTGDVERVGCGWCGVQLIRREGEQWQTIRG